MYSILHQHTHRHTHTHTHTHTHKIACRQLHKKCTQITFYINTGHKLFHHTLNVYFEHLYNDLYITNHCISCCRCLTLYVKFCEACGTPYRYQDINDNWLLSLGICDMIRKHIQVGEYCCVVTHISQSHQPTTPAVHFANLNSNMHLNCLTNV